MRSTRAPVRDFRDVVVLPPDARAIMSSETNSDSRLAPLLGSESDALCGSETSGGWSALGLPSFGARGRADGSTTRHLRSHGSGANPRHSRVPPRDTEPRALRLTQRALWKELTEFEPQACKP